MKYLLYSFLFFSCSVDAEVKNDSAWIPLGLEYNKATVPQNTLVRFGIEGHYLYKKVSGDFVPTIAFFGGDPAPGVVKNADAYLPFKLNDKVVKGTIKKGDNIIYTNEDLGVQPGDYVIFETGAEEGKGMRGTIGVGGQWPYLYYPTEEAMKADLSKKSGTYAFALNTGNTFRFDHTWQPYTLWYYFTEKAIPFSFVGKVISTSKNKIVTDTKAAADAKLGNVYVDNTATIKLFAENRYSKYIKLPKGKFALAGTLTINRETPFTLAGDGTVLFSPKGSPSATVRVFAKNAKIQNITIIGNSGANGFALTQGYYPVDGYFDNPFLGRGGLQIINSHNVTASGIKVVDALAYSLQAYSSDSIFFNHCEVVSNEGSFGYTGWDVHFTDCRNSGADDIKYYSANARHGFEAFGSDNIYFKNIHAVNAIGALNNAGHIVISNADMRIDSLPFWMKAPAPFWDVNAQVGKAYQGALFRQVKMRTRVGNPGIYGRDNTPGVKVVDGTYEGSAAALHLEATDALIDSFVTTGNIELQRGTNRNSFIRHTTATMITTDYGVTVSNNVGKLVTPPQPQLMQSASVWTNAVSQNGAFVLQADGEVRYGSGSKWITQKAKAGEIIVCSDARFTDPAVGVIKHCEYRNE